VPREHRPPRIVRILRLAEVEPTRIGDALWKPIRSELGVEAFGINAYVAEAAGDPLFDEHDETEAGAGTQRHEELYLVLSGRATFTGDAEEVDGPPGTIVFFKDAAERRGARAAEPNTTVIAIGGPVGEGYEIAPWEYWFRVKRARDQGRADEARVIAEEGVARHPTESRLRRLLRE
jgi:hypothetical protein